METTGIPTTTSGPLSQDYSTITVEVFKTDVQHQEAADGLVEVLLNAMPETKINFDLEDIDKILRIAGTHVDAKEVAALLGLHGYYCESL